MSATQAYFSRTWLSEEDLHPWTYGTFIVGFSSRAFPRFWLKVKGIQDSIWCHEEHRKNVPDPHKRVWGSVWKIWHLKFYLQPNEQRFAGQTNNLSCAWAMRQIPMIAADPKRARQAGPAVLPACVLHPAFRACVLAIPVTIPLGFTSIWQSVRLKVPGNQKRCSIAESVTSQV